MRVPKWPFCPTTDITVPAFWGIRNWEGITSGSEQVWIAFRLRDFEPMVTITSRFPGSGRAAVVG